MNVPRELGRRLAAEGHECRHVGDIGMAQTSDIVTHDLDYGHLLAFFGEPTPSVIIFRLRPTYRDNLFARVMSTGSEIEKPLSEGAIVALEDAAVRIRRLPITQGE